MSETRKVILQSKKVIILVILDAGSMAAILIVAPSITQANAQQQQVQNVMWSGQGIPQMSGL